MAYARSVMQHYLTNVSGIAYGNKHAVANEIANNNGAMTMYNTEAASNSPVTGQDLQANETVAVGTSAYLGGSTRNAALEEILHFVHDYGLSKVYPSFQTELEAASIYGMDNQIFIPWANLPVADYDNEYWASFNDAYWGATEKRGNDLPYLFLSREACKAGDALGSALMQKFLPNYFTSLLYVSNTFQGTFYLTKQSNLSYTSQSQYYKDVSLWGNQSSNLFGNDWDNNLYGNSGNNELKGGEGNDKLDGRDGIDKALYNGPLADYTITNMGSSTLITDNNSSRDGTDTLVNIEHVTFADQTINL